MSTETSQNFKSVLKNTLLYFRMLLTMVVSLYTSRVVFGALGMKVVGKLALKNEDTFMKMGIDEITSC